MIRRAALLLAVALLCACGERTPAERAAAGSAAAVSATQRIASRHLRRQTDAAPHTLDPSLNTDVSAQEILDDLFEGLVRLDPGGKVVPAAARSWERATDGLSWTFHLDPAARWSNGQQLTAQDFVYAWRRTVNPATASQSAQWLAPIANAIAIAAGKLPPESLGVRAVDAQTLQVQLTQPTAYFLYLLTNCYLYPQPQATIEKYGSAWTKPGNLVSNGPFVLEDMRINGAVQLRRNALFREAAAVRLDKVTYYPEGDASVDTARYLAGDVDLTDRFGLEDVDWLRAKLGTQVLLAPYFGTVMLAMHVGRPPFDSRPLRQAMTLAIDRDLLTQKLLHGLYLPAYNLVPPLEGYEAATPDWARLSAGDRHAKARALYAQAGYSKNHPLMVDLFYATTDPDTRRMLEALAAMWQVNLGAEVRLATQEWRVFLQNRRLGKYELYWAAWIGDYPDPLTFLGLWQSNGGQNDGKYNEARFDQWVTSAAATTEESQRVRAYGSAESILNDDAPFIPIYFYQSRHLVQTYVQGWRSNIMDRHLSRDLYLADRPDG